MTPSEVAAVLGLDEQDAVRVVPFEQQPFVRPESAPAEPRRVTIPGAANG